MSMSSTKLDDDFWVGATFQPEDHPSRLEALRERVRALRRIAFQAICLKLRAEDRELYEKSGLELFCAEVEQYAPARLDRLFEYPPFLVALDQCVAAGESRPELARTLPHLARTGRELELPETSRLVLRHGEATVLVQRFDVDPLVAAAAAPEYRLPTPERRREFAREVVYPDALFLDMLRVAVTRIGRAWPEAEKAFFSWVRVVVDMVDSDMTSYSASEVRGTIFVSTDNSPLVALEEFVVHELGHQILYAVMELDPLVEFNDGIYTLPWSGRTRDLYGYFHAFYIYVLVARYLVRVEGRSAREQRRVDERLRHIVSGFDTAIAEIGEAGAFTPRGRNLFDNIAAEARRVALRLDRRGEGIEH